METKVDEKRVLTIKELAKRWGVGRGSIQRAIQVEEIPAIRIGWNYKISLDWVERVEREGNLAEVERQRYERKTRG